MYKIYWFEKNKIQPEHSNLPVTQVYCWLISSDKKIALVSKDGIKWQFPGGHPQPGESLLQALQRELIEEVSYQLSKNDIPVFFGYRLIEEYDENEVLITKYLQTRFYLILNKSSSEISIIPNEKETEIEKEKIVCAKWHSLKEACSNISWLKSSEEFKSITSSGII